MHGSNQAIINAWLSIGSAYAAEVIANQDFDAVTIDAQHGMIGFETGLAMLQAVSSTKATPLVRPSALLAPEIMRWLDAGTYGIICPMISTPAHAIQLVEACRYPPLGGRSYGPARGLLYGGSDYLAGADSEILVFAMIETNQALQNLEAIVATPGLDGVYIGPNDLSLALGFAPANEPTEPVVRDAIERIRTCAAAAGKIAGIFCSDGAAAAMRISEGFDLVTPGNDAALLRGAMAKAAGEARSGGCRS